MKLVKSTIRSKSHATLKVLLLNGLVSNPKKALMYCLKYDSSDCFDLIIHYLGQDLKLKAKKKILKHAVKLNRHQCVQSLATHKIIDLGIDKDMALKMAINSSSYSSLKILLKNGVKPTAYNVNDMTIYPHTIGFSCINLLLKYGWVPINDFSRIIVQHIILYQNLNHIEYMVQSGNMIANSWNLLMVGCLRHRRINFLRGLLQSDHRPEHSKLRYFYSVLVLGCSCSLEKFISYGADPGSILEYVVSYGKYKILVKMLLSGLDPNVNHNRALIRATEKKSAYMELLINHGADIHFQDDYLTYLAITKSNYPVLKLLLESGSNPNALNGKIMRAGARLKKRGHFRYERLLRKHGGILHR